jgi:hypothetical protein
LWLCCSAHAAPAMRRLERHAALPGVPQHMSQPGSASSAMQFFEKRPNVLSCSVLPVLTETQAKQIMSKSLGRLGGGSFGVVHVHRCCSHATVPEAVVMPAIFAVKTFRENCPVEDRQRERSALNTILESPHPNLLQALAVVLDRNYMPQCLFLPLCDGTLHNAMQARHGLFPAGDACHLAFQVASL